MTAFRLTKYNPKLRSKNGIYRGKEWTDFFSFQKYYNPDLSKLSEYIEVEDRYVSCILQFLSNFKIDCMISDDLSDFRQEPWAKMYLTGLEDAGFKISDNFILNKNLFPVFIRLMLRGLLVGRLHSLDKSIGVYIDEDMYVFLVIPDDIEFNLSKFTCKGLFIENYSEEWL